MFKTYLELYSNHGNMCIVGLAEVSGGMGLADLHKLMPTLINTTERIDIPSHVRDGYVMMYIYLPSVFKDDFKQYVGPIIPSILLVCTLDNVGNH